MASLKNYDDVRGDIIGGYFQHVILVRPDGKKSVQAYIDRDQCPVEWAKKQVKGFKDQPCGNGKPLSDYPDIFNSIYGKGDFTVLTNY